MLITSHLAIYVLFLKLCIYYKFLQLERYPLVSSYSSSFFDDVYYCIVLVKLFRRHNLLCNSIAKRKLLLMIPMISSALICVVAVCLLYTNIKYVDSFSMTSHQLSSTSPRYHYQLYSTVEANEVTTEKKGGINNWFPIKPADALSESNGYDSLVKSAYLRHILVASNEMADLLLGVYLKGGSIPGNDETYIQTDGDIFNRLANDVSLCSSTR